MMDEELMTLVWYAYWDEGNTKTALERVVQVVRDYDKAALASAQASSVTKLSQRRKAA
ncbi:hypothetical protein DFR47_11060 [Pseudochrobactrum asaccharolyticum]|uniref:Uncharacterized protein n=2 Tax=Pseudochrobactrum asaccharolyticum TaxID=354351 RepID=A0A366DLV1_9HYPH|nr:hypothetical protein DFR47_11060 [Pseudochrobactrum asaccharolyticum]